jgi:hypothetical protein
MEAELVVKSIMGLIVILALLIFLLFLEPTPNSPNKNTSSTEKAKVYETTDEIKTDMNSLVKIIKTKKSTAKELSEALDLIIKYHGTVHAKLGLRSHPDFDIYADILFTICRHRNANKDLIIKFDKELAKLNPEYKKDINEAMTKGLTSRRV